jgi:UDP-glucose-4-epimerase GalE
MRVLVTGGAGYIGSHVAWELKAHGHEVVAYDNLSRGRRELAKNCEFIEGDLRDADRLKRALHGIDAVMHFAGYIAVGESVERPREYFENNVLAGLDLLNAVREAGIRCFVFSSTAAVYGNPAKVPITEDAPLQPLNPYGYSKLFFEQALESYGRAYGLRFASLRYFNAAGAHESGELGEMHNPETHLIPNVLAAAGQRPEVPIFGKDYPTPDGTCIRDYIHIIDLAQIHIRAVERLAEGGESMVVNVGTGKGHSVEEVVATAETVTGRKIARRYMPRRPGDAAILVADPSRAEKLLGWRASRSLHDIISSAWKWVQRQAGSK